MGQGRQSTGRRRPPWRRGQRIGEAGRLATARARADNDGVGVGSLHGASTAAALLSALAAAALAGCAWFALPGPANDTPSPAPSPTSGPTPGSTPGPTLSPTPSPTPSTAQPPAAPDIAALRDRIRGHAKAHCGACHQSSLPSHKAAAVAIYDLDRADWYAMLTVPRLQRGFPRRLNAKLDEAGQRDLQSFIDHEVALRQR